MRSLRCLTYAVLIIFAIQFAFGLGIAPAQKEVDFEKGETYEGSFRIISDELDYKVILSAEGDIADYIEFDQMNFIVDEEEEVVEYKINMDEDLRPGVNKGGIMVIKVPKESSSGGTIMATTALIHQIKVNVPFAEKYAEGKVYISNKEVDKDILFTVSLRNFGNERIDSVKGNIVIKGPTNEELDSFSTDEMSIGMGEESKITGLWKTENQGKYFAEITVVYDDKIMEFEESFYVGEQSIEIEDLDIENFRLGQIVKLDVMLRNKWNEPLTVSGEIDIMRGNKLITSFDTVPVDMQKKSSTIMYGYWDTKDLEIGEYDIFVKANYGEKESEKLFNTIVSIDEIKVSNLLTAKAISEKEDKRSYGLIVFLVVVLIIVNICLFIFVIKKQKRVRREY